jgi:hypothetical protein
MYHRDYGFCSNPVLAKNGPAGKSPLTVPDTTAHRGFKPVGRFKALRQAKFGTTLQLKTQNLHPVK